MNKPAVNISAVIITYNEEHNIERCLHSVAAVADEIVVVDSFSTDSTAGICEAYGARFVQHAFEGHIQQKNYAVALTESDYILSLDADEALTGQLRNAIQAVKNNWAADAYSCNRRTNYCGRWVRHSGWYPDQKVRLWNRTKGLWGGTNPHDRVLMNEGARIDHLEGDLLHFSYTSIRQHLARMNAFSDIAAAEAHKSGKSSILIRDMVVNPMFTFFKKYVLQLGFLDGETGFLIAAHSAYGKFLKYAKLREINRQAPVRGNEGQ